MTFGELRIFPYNEEWFPLLLEMLIDSDD